MRVRISDPALLGDLQSYLEAVECTVRRVGEGTLDVAMARAPSEEQARREVDIYLRAWQAMNPDTYARVVGPGDIEGPSA
jgi:hypothetical protein